MPQGPVSQGTENSSVVLPMHAHCLGMLSSCPGQIMRVEGRWEPAWRPQFSLHSAHHLPNSGHQALVCWLTKATRQREGKPHHQASVPDYGDPESEAAIVFPLDVLYYFTYTLLCSRKELKHNEQQDISQRPRNI